MEDDLKFLKKEDNLNFFLKMEVNLQGSQVSYVVIEQPGLTISRYLQVACVCTSVIKIIKSQLSQKSQKSKSITSSLVTLIFSLSSYMMASILWVLDLCLVARVIQKYV
jgi:hypothetical protein